MKDLFATHPQSLVERTRDGRGFCLVHGDVGAGNVLVPKLGSDPIYIIDRQPFDWSLTTWLGVYDLAYALVLDWDVEIRRECEKLILRNYHHTLVAQGVEDYSWEQLLLDYRLMVAMCVYIPIEYCRGGVQDRLTPVWMPMLKNALIACDDHDVARLWD
jgi:hypothetical protein